MPYNDVQFNFEDKNALVIGGSRGIGAGVVRALSSAGANVTYASRSEIGNEFNVNFVEVDVRREPDIRKLFAEIDSAGRLDILINTAAINYYKSISEIETEEWDEVLDVNLKAVFILCREASIRMKKQSNGKIVIVSSIAGRNRSLVSGAHYTASKAGIIGLTRQLAFELGQFGVNVNATCPSQTMTEMFFSSMSDGQQKELADSIPLKRVASVAEQVGPILFLCSDAASYITGAVIDVNGGQI